MKIVSLKSNSLKTSEGDTIFKSYHRKSAFQKRCRLEVYYGSSKNSNTNFIVLILQLSYEILRNHSKQFFPSTVFKECFQGLKSCISARIKKLASIRDQKHLHHSTLIYFFRFTFFRFHERQ